MKLTKLGVDLIKIDEDYKPIMMDFDHKFHIIKLSFKEPNVLKILNVLKTFKDTNRFIVDDNIKVYNSALKSIDKKKYYVENVKGDDLITFFRRNNKVLLNTLRLDGNEVKFISHSKTFSDILKNLEVILVSDKFFKEKRSLLEN